jgi:transposase-like protein
MKKCKHKLKFLKGNRYVCDSCGSVFIELSEARINKILSLLAQLDRKEEE